MNPVARVLSHIRQNRYSYLVILAALVIEVFLITRPLSFLLTNLIPDDSFYYFQIARNIVHGGGSTFDGIHPTNGYHPLWLLVLLPAFSIFSVGGLHDVAPIYAALTLSVLLNAATMVCVLMLVSRFTENYFVRAFAVAVYALNPFVIYESLNGLETSLALFFLALFFLASLAIERSDRRRDYICAGIVGGLLVLARIDMALYVAAVGIWIFFRYGVREGFVRAVWFSIPAAVFILPWLASNILWFHMLLTSAAGATALVNHTLTLLDGGAGIASQAKAILYMLVTYGTDVLVRTGAAWLLFLLTGMYLAVLASGGAQLPKARRDISILAALFCGFILLFIIDAGVRFTARSYYFISIDLFCAIWAAYVLASSVRRARFLNVLLAGLGVSLICSFGIGWYSTLRDQNASQATMYEMSQWLSTNLPPGTPVGVFNAGIEGYFSSVRVVNLDGLVNNSSYDALTRHALYAYLTQNRIALVADFPLYITYRYRSFFGVPDTAQILTPIGTLPGTGAHGTSEGLTLYQVEE